MSHIDPTALETIGDFLRGAGYRFVTVTPSTHHRINSRDGNERARDLRGVFGWSRPFDAALLEPELLGLMRDAGVLVQDGNLLRSAIRVSTVDDLMLMHSAWPTRADDAVFFGPDSYRFTGALQRALAWIDSSPLRAIDIGCGTGAAALIIARTFPHAAVIGADVNPKALDLAAVNTRLASLHNVTLSRSDLFDDIDGDFDLIVSNPPFVLDSQARQYRDGGGQRGAELSRRIVEESLERLRPGGSLMLYTGVAITGANDHFLEDVRPVVEARCDRWSYEELDPDIFGSQLGEPGYEQVERIAAVWLQAVKR